VTDHQTPSEPSSLPEPPAWADDKTAEINLSEWSRALGEVWPIDDQPFRVAIVQFEEVDLTTSPITVVRSEPQLRINGNRYALDQASALADIIATGLRMVELRHPVTT
jgi:hypothetical protein